MKRIYIYLCLVLLPLGLSAQGFQLPKYEKFQLKNGLTVYLMEQHEVPMINVSLLINAGAIKDGDQAGIASVTAESWLYGTKKFTKEQIEEETDFIGASLGAYAGSEYAKLASSFASRDQDKMLEIIQEVVLNPSFNEEEFSKLKTRTLAELDQARESPRQVIGSYFNKLLFDAHVYGNVSSGTKSSIEKISMEDVKTFFADNYQSNEAALAIVGDFKTSDMKQKITKLFSNWKESSKKSPQVESPSLAFDESRVLLVNKLDARETTFLIGGKGVSRDNPDYVAIQVVNTVLGGRFTSWLNDALRVNSGLTYGARSGFANYRQAGTFSISSFTKNSTTVEAIDMALDVLDSLHQHGLNAQILESSKNYIKGGFPPDYETNNALSNLLTDMFFYGFDEGFINNFQKNVDGLTVEKSKEIIGKYFPKDKLQFVLVGKADEIREKVKKYGTLVEKDIKEDEF